jgi:hypothetical protein
MLPMTSAAIANNLWMLRLMRLHAAANTDLEKMKQNVVKRKRLRLKTLISSGRVASISQMFAFKRLSRKSHNGGSG